MGESTSSLSAVTNALLKLGARDTMTAELPVVGV
jgi:hypothetical protein